MRQGNVETTPMFVHVEKRKVHACTNALYSYNYMRGRVNVVR